MLIKGPSEKAVGQNIKAEVAAGKPQKQAIAIALSTQRRARGKGLGKNESNHGGGLCHHPDHQTRWGGLVHWKSKAAQ